MVLDVCVGVFFVCFFFGRDACLKSITIRLYTINSVCCFSLFAVLVWISILFEVHHSPCKHQLEDMSFC